MFIRGSSGSGKSRTALSLMRRGHALVADDLVEVVSDPGRSLVGRALEDEVRVEVRGLGIFRARTLFPLSVLESCRIDLIADLDAYQPLRDSGRIRPETRQDVLLDSEILAIRVPIAEGMDPALLIEILALRFRETGTVNP